MSISDITVAIVAPYLYIVCLTIFASYVFRKKLRFQNLLPVTLITATLFIYFTTALFHNISAGFWLTVIISASAIALLIKDKNRLAFLREQILTPGFVVFSILYGLLFILNWSTVVPLQSDTAMHWAPHVWAMWLRDDFYTSPGLSIVNHGDYPPAIQLFELILSKAAGMYREGFLFFSIQILGLSMLLPITNRLTWHKHNNLRRWIAILLLTATLLSIPLVFFVSGYFSTLEVDTILAIIFAFCVFSALQESKKHTIRGTLTVALLLTFLCLTKQIAILLAAIVLLIYVTGLYITYRQQIGTKTLVMYLKGWRKKWPTIISLATLVMLPLAALAVWAHQINGYTSPDPGIAIFHITPADALQLPDILAGTSGTDAQQYFSRAFVSHVLFSPAGFVVNILYPISYMQVALLFVGLMIYLWATSSRNITRNRVFMVGIIVTAGWFLYLFALYCVFLFGGMKDVELSNLNTSDRYIRTYLLAMLVMVILLYLKRVVSTFTKVGSKSIYFFVASLLVIFAVFFNKSTFDLLVSRSNDKHRAEFESLNTHQTRNSLLAIARASGDFDNPNKILVTAKTDAERHYLQYVALPNRITLLLPEDTHNIQTVCDKITRSDYFVIGNDYFDPAGWSAINSCLITPMQIESGDIYKVNKPDNNLTLVDL